MLHSPFLLELLERPYNLIYPAGTEKSRNRKKTAK
jgi:hypothetical protein